LYVKNDLGSVRVQGCDLQAVSSHPGSQIEGSPDVSLHDCRSYGAPGIAGGTWPSCDGGAGVQVAGSSVAATFCDLRGGAGAVGGAQGCQGCAGGSGLMSTTSSFLHAAGTLLTGANGAHALDGCSGGNFLCNGGYGGNGSDLLRSGYVPEAHTFWSFGNAFAIGAPGQGGHGMCGCGLFPSCDGEPGEAGVNVRSDSHDSVQVSARLAPLLELTPNPARETATVRLSFLGQPNARVLLSVSSQTIFRPRPQQGVQHVSGGRPHVFQIVGTTDASGQLVEGWVIPELGPGVESVVVYLQPLFVDASGVSTWGSPLGLVLLDSSF
jgi:hypothetical protein